MLRILSRKPVSLPEPGAERREFFRLDFRHPVKFRQIVDGEGAVRLGSSENISQSGILFKTRQIPPLSSLLWMDVDLRTLHICKEIETRAVVRDQGLLGRVVRVELDPDEKDVYDIGVCFLRREDYSEGI